MWTKESVVFHCGVPFTTHGYLCMIQHVTTNCVRIMLSAYLIMFKIHISFSLCYELESGLFKVNSLIVMIWFCNITGGLMSLASLTGYHYSLFKGQGQAPGYKEFYEKSAIAHLKKALQVLCQSKWNSRHTALWVKEQGTNHLIRILRHLSESYWVIFKSGSWNILILII